MEPTRASVQDHLHELESGLLTNEKTRSSGYQQKLSYVGCEKDWLHLALTCESRWAELVTCDRAVPCTGRIPLLKCFERTPGHHLYSSTQTLCFLIDPASWACRPHNSWSTQGADLLWAGPSYTLWRSALRAIALLFVWYVVLMTLTHSWKKSICLLKDCHQACWVSWFWRRKIPA